MHSHFSHCSSTSHTPVPHLPGWRLQLPVITSMHPPFLKPGAPCSGLWNWHRWCPLHEQAGGIHCPGSFSAFSRTFTGKRCARSLASKAPKARGVFWLLRSETSIGNGCFQGDSIESLPFISHCVHHITVFKTKEISLQQGGNQLKKKKPTRSHTHTHHYPHYRKCCYRWCHRIVSS